ncbi:MAG: hypothetical protein IKS30_06580, partial [Treponema sp.]|nr:hypothetical protein [Treponema sp.]
WDVGHYFSASKNGNKPTLAADKTGNLFSSWTIMGSSQVQMQKGISGTNKAVWVSYDQPDQESYISIDKNSTEGDLALIFSTAHVGSSGKGTSNGYADLNTIGGMMGTGIPNNFSSINVSTNANSVLDIKIAGNPYSTMDKTHAPGFQLASYAMIRDVSKYTTGHSARYGTNMHFAYYDAKNKALRYTYQPTVTNAQNTTDEYRYSISGWTVIDGNTDGQDRVHNGDTYGLSVSSYSAENKTVTFSTTVSASAGDTLGLAYESSSGLHKFDLFTVSASVTNKKTVSFTGDFTDTVSGTPTGGAIYRGETNYLTKTKNGLDNVKTVGPYNAIDVTKTGNPVIVYFDADNETLRIAYTSSATPSMTDTATGRDKWTRQSLTGIVSGGTYVQAKIDGNNYLHIVYRNAEGNMCYIKSRNAPDGAEYEFDKADVMKIDTSGTYGTLSLIRSGTGTYTYTPCVSWLNSEGTANGVKYALLRTVDIGGGETASRWDTMIVPAVSGNYVTGGEYIYTEGYNGWTANSANITDSVNTAKCDAIIGYNTGRMDVLFLKSE